MADKDFDMIKDFGTEKDKILLQKANASRVRNVEQVKKLIKL